MKFPYISIAPLISELQAKYKFLNQSGALADDDCYQYAAEAIRLIGGHHHDPHTSFLFIKNHTCPLPKDFYTAGRLYRCDHQSYTAGYAGVIKEVGIAFPRLNMMIPVEDEGTLRYMEDNESLVDAKMGHGVDTFVLKVPPGVINVSFSTGVLEMKYWRFKTDRNGAPMAQDCEEVLQAIKFYILENALHEEALFGRIAKYAYDDIKQSRATYEGLAQNIMMAESEQQFAVRAARQRGQHKKFEL